MNEASQKQMQLKELLHIKYKKLLIWISSPAKTGLLQPELADPG